VALRLPPAPAAPLMWRTNAWLFVATVASVFFTYFDIDLQRGRAIALAHATQFTVSLLGILLAHEFGHYIAARIHKVDASLPYFLPLPLLSPFGTMGAVIRMRSTIPTRRALLDIGAAGPIAGLVLAIPLYAWGVAHSQIVTIEPGSTGSMQLGSSLLTVALDKVFAPAVPEGSDIFLSPVAFAAWAGMFVTMINLLPASQLDGGHVAYALFGRRQDGIAKWVHRSMLAFFFVSLGSYVARDVRAGFGLWHLGRHVNNSLFWLVWFEILAVLGTLATRDGKRHEDEPQALNNRTRVFATLGLAILAGVFHDRSSPLLWGAWFAGLAVLLAMEARWGALRSQSTLLDHPPTGPAPLGVGRAIVAIITLAFFALLFMPTPIAL
jgi:membrane-associated protease RseP (regulator of RpoE activity)